MTISLELAQHRLSRELFEAHNVGAYGGGKWGDLIEAQIKEAGIDPKDSAAVLRLIMGTLYHLLEAIRLTANCVEYVYGDGAFDGLGDASDKKYQSLKQAV